MVANCYGAKPFRADISEAWELEGPTWPHHEASFFPEAAGIRWHVQQMGQGPPLLLLHGTGASTHSWRKIMPLLAMRYSVTAIDLPGHAFTESLRPPHMSIEGMSGALAALLQRMQVSPCYCAGHSAGVVILCHMTSHLMIRPRHIVSVNGAFLPIGGPAGRVFAPAARLLANNPWIARWVAPRPDQARATVKRLIARTGSQLDEEGIELYVRLVRQPRHVAGALSMMAHWHLQACQKTLSEIAVPITLLVGGNDLMVSPQQAVRVQRLLKNATLRRVEGLGHLAHEERPEQFADEVAAVCVMR